MIKQIEIYESPSKEKNEEKFGFVASGIQCICCMKPIKEGSRYYEIHATTDWMAVPYDTTEKELQEAGLESQGVWGVGSACARRFRMEYLNKVN